MRLVRLERQQSRVADDVRAALASLGRGSTVIGGIALIGVGSVTERPIEAVVLLPHGVIIVIGVDLPDPALRLEAPLGAAWKSDGWPLVAGDDAVNPATEALDLSQACERRIAELVPGTAPVGTIVAVGPYVETVDQPAGDLAGPVRVLHPTPTTMLAATVSLATARRPRSVDQVRALIRGLAPEAPEFSDEVLLREGFSRFTDDSPPESLWDVPAAPGAGTAATSSATASPAKPEAADVAGPEPAADAQPTETAAEPDLPTAAETAAPHSDAKAPAAESERTEVLPSPEEPDRPADAAVLRRFPGAGTPTPFPRPTGTDTERTETPAPDTERTENLSFPAEPDRTTARPAEPGQATTQFTQSRRATTHPAEAEQPTEPAAGSPRPFPTPSPVPRPTPPPAPAPRPAARGSRTVRWLPLGAIGLLVALVAAAVAIATTGDDTAAAPTGPPTPATQPPPSSAAAPAESLRFALRVAGGDQGCASHAFGDAQASLQRTSCSGVRRASYAATIDGRPGAVTIGIVAFPDAAQAAAFKAVADTPGGGGIVDLATETGKWGATVPRFENAAYASKLESTSVRIVQAVWAPGPSTPDDPGLTRAVKAALDLPAQ
ncbi:hypothetical protein [Amycolatopsis sp. NPDC051128]|uniref:hypothetical protein n=1 Tax=Amycolatopsis sp. NPDC051128 TaxID=3155412 RepID=UPI003448899D